MMQEVLEAIRLPIYQIPAKTGTAVGLQWELTSFSVMCSSRAALPCSTASSVSDTRLMARVDRRYLHMTIHE